MKSADSDDFGERGFCPTRGFFFGDVSGFFLTVPFFAIGLPPAASVGALLTALVAAAFVVGGDILTAAFLADLLTGTGVFEGAFLGAGDFLPVAFLTAIGPERAPFLEGAFVRADLARAPVLAGFVDFRILTELDAALRALVRRGAAFFDFAFTGFLGLLSAILVAMHKLSSFAEAGSLLTQSRHRSGASPACPVAPIRRSQSLK